MNNTAKHYRQAQNSALIVRRSQPDALLATGPDRLDLLQRMSTNQVGDIVAGQARMTVLTNAIGRLIDAITVVESGDSALLVTSPGEGQHVLDWLRDYIFFKDDVALDLVDIPLFTWGIYGPETKDRLDQLGAGPGTFSVESGQDLRAVWPVEKPVPGWELLLGGASAGEAERIWPDALQPSARAAYEALRIEAGLPRPGHEYAPEMTPLEGGLGFAVHAEKGCYIGQEVIARMLSRDQVPRRVLGVNLEGAAVVGESLYVDDDQVGELTSAAESPVRGWIGLARVDKSTQSTNVRVWLPESRIHGTLRHLPFD
ncbi:MAG: glycine cleavage T C-terminal barrel domain-containing protein [Anaerolineales bacterium]|nr:glycine cleavage T C-terminal barrel domain-containing protein [Anaerolineales bacterium]